MKKILIVGVVASVLCDVAGAATKCVALDADTRSVDWVDNRDTSDWTMNLDNGVTLHGISMCGGRSGATYYGDMTDMVDLDSWPKGDPSCNRYTSFCWCRVIEPFVSRWVVVALDGTDVCQSNCSFFCPYRLDAALGGWDLDEWGLRTYVPYKDAILFGKVPSDDTADELGCFYPEI